MIGWWVYGYVAVALFMFGTFKTSGVTEVLLALFWPVTLPVRLGAAFG